MPTSNASAPVPVPFEVSVPDATLDDLRTRLARTRWADDFANETWSFGVERGYLTELTDYWRDGFDWRAQEAAMNAFSHWTVDVDGVPLHFLREPGRGPDPLPLVLTHGWPWTFWDYERVIRPLADPASFGGDPRDAFEVIVPSLPGYAFSSPLRTPGIGFVETADLWARLMRDVLGFDRFGAHGGDSGAYVSAQLGHAYEDRVVGVHLHFPMLLSLDFTTLLPDDYGPGEEGWFEQNRSGRHVSHYVVQIDDPQTLAYAMHDSPVGMAAWLLERRRAWSDCNGDVESRFTKDQLLTNASLYWLTETFATSVRFYAESYRTPWTPRHDRTPTVRVPTGIAVFPRELMLVPREVAARHADLVHWTVMPRGGHFAPMEEPELLVDDLRTFYRSLR